MPPDWGTPEAGGVAVGLGAAVVGFGAVVAAVVLGAAVVGAAAVVGLVEVGVVAAGTVVAGLVVPVEQPVTINAQASRTTRGTSNFFTRSSLKIIFQAIFHLRVSYLTLGDSSF
jgi:hypothetical protein